MSEPTWLAAFRKFPRNLLAPPPSNPATAEPSPLKRDDAPPLEPASPLLGLLPPSLWKDVFPVREAAEKGAEG